MNETIERLQAALPERYTILREIGRGGMATVYLAKERHPSRQVAIKVLEPALSVRLGRERFLRETDVVSKLTHPHIVPIYAAGEAAGFFYYVMPYVEGETLGTRLRTGGPLATPDALRIARDIAEALAYAHRRHIVHRDIKPDNVMLHDGYPLVMDFGIARALSASGDEQLTERGLTLGTPAYMSPEQAAGAEDVGPATDVYALGCVLFEMLTGHPPFGRGSPTAVLPRHITEAAPSARSHAPDVPTEVDQATRRAMAKAPDERFPSAAAMAGELDRLRSAMTSGSRLSAVTGARWSRRRRWGVGAGMVALVGIFVAMLWPPDTVLPVVERLLTLPPEYTDSIAVMPVENLTDVPALDRVADAITYETISRLRSTPGVKVSAYVSVRALRDQAVDPAAVDDSLGVRLVLWSQLRTVGDRVLLTTEVVDAQDGRVVRDGEWGLGPLGNGGTAEHAMVRNLVDLVGAATGLTTSTGAFRSTSGPAHDAYLLGEHWLGRRTPDAVSHAIARYREAVALDTTYAAAYEGLSSAYTLALVYRHEIGMTGYATAASALWAASRAIALDPTLAEAYAARGLIVSRSYGPIALALSDFDRALELAPNADEVVAWSAAVLGQQGRMGEALAAAQRGVELSPFAPGRHMGVAHNALAAGRYDLAARAARQVTELEPALIEARAIEGFALVLGGRASECLALDFGAHAVVRALCLHALGRAEEARALADSVVQAAAGSARDTVHTEVVGASGLAAYFAFAADVPEAFEWLEYAFTLSPMAVDVRVLSSPLFDSLRATAERRARLDAVTAAVWPRVERERAVRDR